MIWLSNYLMKRNLRKQIALSRSQIGLLSRCQHATLDDAKLAEEILEELKLIRALEYRLSVLK